jgi:hypothetical protein
METWIKLFSNEEMSHRGISLLKMMNRVNRHRFDKNEPESLLCEDVQVFRKQTGFLVVVKLSAVEEIVPFVPGAIVCRFYSTDNFGRKLKGFRHLNTNPSILDF